MPEACFSVLLAINCLALHNFLLRLKLLLLRLMTYRFIRQLCLESLSRSALKHKGLGSYCSLAL